MPAVLIIGASRGLGLALVDVHLADGWKVHGTTRGSGVPRDHPNLVLHHLEVRDRSQLERMIQELDQPFDRMIHNAGIKSAPRGELIEVNAKAPIRVIERLIEVGRLKAGGTVAIMTSRLGARGGTSGSLGDYGDSKAALNDEFRLRTNRWGKAGALAVVIHPGWVRTEMGGPKADLSVEESVKGIKLVLDSLTPADHGKFLAWNGETHQW